MILKSLSVLAACAAFAASAANPVAAQRTPGQNNAASKSQAQTAPARGSSQPPQQSNRPKPWWVDDKIKKELGLTVAQVKAIDDIYTSSKDELAGFRETVEREKNELDRMIVESKVEQWVVLRQIDRMETARSQNNKALYMMLYRMNRQLTAEQRVKLTALESQRRSGRGATNRDPKPAR